MLPNTPSPAVAQEKSHKEGGAIQSENRTSLPHGSALEPQDNLTTAQLSATLLAILQLATLVLWTQLPVIKTRLSLAAASLSLVVAGSVGVLTYAEHLHSVHPSTVLTGYYLVSLVCDIARARTLWLSEGGSRVASVFTGSIAVRVLLLALELVDKSRVFLPSEKEITPEERSGLLKRSLFFWLNPLLGRGFQNILSLEDLIPIAHDLRGKSLERLVPFRWAQGISAPRFTCVEEPNIKFVV